MMTLFLVIPRLLHYEESKKFRCTRQPSRNLVLEQHLSRQEYVPGESRCNRESFAIPCKNARTPNPN